MSTGTRVCRCIEGEVNKYYAKKNWESKIWESAKMKMLKWVYHSQKEFMSEKRIRLKYIWILVKHSEN